MVIYPKTPEELERFYLSAAGQNASIATIDTQIVVLQAAITANTAAITANTAAISANTAAIAELVPDAFIDIEIDDVPYKLPAKLP